MTVYTVALKDSNIEAEIPIVLTSDENSVNC